MEPLPAVAEMDKTAQCLAFILISTPHLSNFGCGAERNQSTEILVKIQTSWNSPDFFPVEIIHSVSNKVSLLFGFPKKFFPFIYCVVAPLPPNE